MSSECNVKTENIKLDLFLEAPLKPCNFTDFLDFPTEVPPMDIFLPHYWLPSTYFLFRVKYFNSKLLHLNAN